MSRNPFLVAALAAAGRGWAVFPLASGGKIPVVRDWERRATTDPLEIHRWWAKGVANNVGVATGRSGLVVIDLDGARGELPPERFAGACSGFDALAMLAVEAGAVMPTDTYTVATPRGRHLYFRAPSDVVLRNSAGSLAWRVDSRANGGYVVGAGSIRSDGRYRVLRGGAVAELPDWLLRALTPALPAPTAPMRLPSARAGAYVRAIVEGEAHHVAVALTGTRHRTLLRAARTLGRLVGGGELSEDFVRDVLRDAAAGHVGVDGWSVAEVDRTIADGMAFGQRLPRRVAADLRPASAT